MTTHTATKSITLAGFAQNYMKLLQTLNDVEDIKLSDDKIDNLYDTIITPLSKKVGEDFKELKQKFPETRIQKIVQNCRNKSSKKQA